MLLLQQKQKVMCLRCAVSACVCVGGAPSQAVHRVADHAEQRGKNVVRAGE